MDVGRERGQGKGNEIVQSPCRCWGTREGKREGKQAHLHTSVITDEPKSDGQLLHLLAVWSEGSHGTSLSAASFLICTRNTKLGPGWCARSKRNDGCEAGIMAPGPQ